jgi:predicted secreted protein
MSQAFTGYGLFLKLGNNDSIGSPPSAETFTAIKEVQMVDLSGSKVDLVDVTHAQSPSARREYIATLIDSGDCSCTANFVPGDTTQVALQGVMDARAARNWEIVLPGALGQFTFSGIVSSLDHNLDFSKEAKLTFKIKITGPLTFA